MTFELHGFGRSQLSFTIETRTNYYYVVIYDKNNDALEAFREWGFHGAQEHAIQRCDFFANVSPGRTYDL